MKIRLQTAFVVILVLLFVWFLYIERAILTPFILGAIFAYIVNPLVNFFSHKIRLPRTLAILVIYLAIVGAVIAAGTLLTTRIINESEDLKNYINSVLKTTKAQVATLPDWLKPVLNDTLVSIQKSKVFSPEYALSLFPQVILRVFSIIIFLFSGFYFLKDGRLIFDKLLSLFSNDYRIEMEILAQKINAVLNGYLRGQILMILYVSLSLFIALSILGVKFALLIAIFSGFAEIVPIIGPIIAGASAVFVVLVSGGVSNFDISPLNAALIAALVYFVLRQLQDYFVIPHVMGRITKLHPLVILFAVLAGEHIGGILGLVLAVPIAATIRIILRYSFDKVYEKGNK